jgi:hypothetical protein
MQATATVHAGNCVATVMILVFSHGWAWQLGLIGCVGSGYGVL